MTDTADRNDNRLQKFFRRLLGDENVIVLVVNPENDVIDYRVEPAADILATLALSDLGTAAGQQPVAVSR